MTGDKKDMGMMNETVDNGGGDDGIGKETAPFIEIKIAGQNKRAFFVSNGDELKITFDQAQQFRNPYEKYKARIEQELLAFCKHNGVQVQILRPSVICGRLYDYPLYSTIKFNVMYGWCRFFWNLQRRGHDEPIRILANDNSVLNIVPVDYAAKACVRSISTSIEQLNIVYSKSVHVKTLMAKMLHRIGFSSYEFVDEMPAVLNISERFYYRVVGNVFGSYINSPKTEYETTRLQEMMSDIPESNVLDSLENLIGFAMEQDFVDLTYHTKNLKLLTTF